MLKKWASDDFPPQWFGNMRFPLIPYIIEYYQSTKSRHCSTSLSVRKVSRNNFQLRFLLLFTFAIFTFYKQYYLHKQWANNDLLHNLPLDIKPRDDKPRVGGDVSASSSRGERTVGRGWTGLGKLSSVIPCSSSI